jgi:hypothetical protein
MSPGKMSGSDHYVHGFDFPREIPRTSAGDSPAGSVSRATDLGEAASDQFDARDSSRTVIPDLEMGVIDHFVAINTINQGPVDDHSRVPSSFPEADTSEYYKVMKLDLNHLPEVSLDQIVADFVTDQEDEEWNVLFDTLRTANDNQVVTANPPIREASERHNAAEYDESDPCEDRNVALKDGLDTEAYGNTDGAAILSSEDSAPDPGMGEFDAGLGDDDWNAIYDMHSAFAEIHQLKLSYSLEPEDATKDREEIAEFLSPGQSNTRLAQDTIDFDEDVNEEAMLQAEAQIHHPRECESIPDEYDVDESLFWLAEGSLSKSRAINEDFPSFVANPDSKRKQSIISNSKLRNDASKGSQDSIQQLFSEDPMEVIPSSPISIIFISSTSSPVRKVETPKTQIIHVIPPFVRSPFPRPVAKQSMIYGVSNKAMIRTCFRIGEIFKAGSSLQSSDTIVYVEFYAAVASSSRCANIQTFNFADIFFPTRPPFVDGSYEGWKGLQLRDHDSQHFLDVCQTHMKMCRAVGTLTKTVAGQLTVKVSSIWEATWDDLKWVRGIVNPGS